MEETYKGYKIEYSEITITFTANIGESNYSNRSLEKVKKHIDNLERKDFKRTDIIFLSWCGSDNYRFGTVTSEIPEGGQVWISYKDEYHGSTRTKQSIDYVFLDNPDNRAILAQITQKKEQIKILTKEIKDYHSEFERYKLGQ